MHKLPGIVHISFINTFFQRQKKTCIYVSLRCHFCCFCGCPASQKSLRQKCAARPRRRRTSVCSCWGRTARGEPRCIASSLTTSAWSWETFRSLRFKWAICSSSKAPQNGRDHSCISMGFLQNKSNLSKILTKQHFDLPGFPFNHVKCKSRFSCEILSHKNYICDCLYLLPRMFVIYFSRWLPKEIICLLLHPKMTYHFPLKFMWPHKWHLVTCT